MITEDSLNTNIGPQFEDNLKSLKASTGLASANYGGYMPTKDIGKDIADKANSLGGLLLSEKDKLLNTALNGLGGLSGKLAFKMPNFGGSKVKEEEDDDSIIKQLIKLIMGIIRLPLRFMSMSQALINGTVALATGIDGLAKSAILGTKDIITLVIAIIKIVAKYFTCILSFIITTLAGCFLIHGITFIFCVLYLIFPVTAYFLEMVSGYDMMPDVDAMFEILGEADDQLGQYTGGIYALKWPDAIRNICYTCFGQKVKLRDVLIDVEIIKDIGDMIMRDFTQVMPSYLKTSIPFGRAAMQHLDKTFN